MAWLAMDLGVVLCGLALLALGRWTINAFEARFHNSPLVPGSLQAKSTEPGADLRIGKIENRVPG